MQIRCRSTQRVYTSSSNPGVAMKGGDVIAGITRFSGPITDLYNEQATINGFLPPAAPSSTPFTSQAISHSTWLANKMIENGWRNVTRRNDCMFGMKPIKLSFTPTVPYMRASSTVMLSANTIISGAPEEMTIPRKIVYRKAPWIPFYGTPTQTATNLSAVTEPQGLTNDSQDGAQTTKAVNFPHLGVYFGMIPGSYLSDSDVVDYGEFPIFECMIEMDVEVKRQKGSYAVGYRVSSSTVPGSMIMQRRGYADWQNLPTINAVNL